MNSIRTYFFIYTLIIINNVCYNFLHISAEHYEIESHYHKKWLAVTLTCLDVDDDTTNPGSHKLKRSLATYDTIRHATSNDSVSEPLNPSEYEAPKIYSKNELYDSGFKERINENDKSKANKYSLSNDAVASKSNDSNSNESDSATKENDSGTDHLMLTSENDINSTAKIVMSIKCDYLELGSNIVKSPVRHLKITSSGTLEITSDWAKVSTKLSALKIESENGLVLPSDCSWVPPSTHSLDLAYTPLHNLSLSDCPSTLKKLSLQGASLHSLSVCLKSLEELDASWNLLSGAGMKSDCEESNMNVKDLKLHNNQISRWSSCGWPSLTHLELQKNELITVNLTSCPPHNLVQINLSNNKLQEPPHWYPPKLSSINLGHNHLKKTTPFNRAVQEIDLSRNSLTTLGKRTFHLASQLLSLDLSHNHLTVIYGHDFIGLHALRYLDLSHNSITHIRHEAFHSLRQVLRIRIDGNSLHQIDSRLLANLPQHLHFRVDNNPWRCSCHLLASLNKASTSFCKPNCHNLPKLVCREGKVEVLAQNVLQQCIEAVEEAKTVRSIFMLPEGASSEEDTSEEEIDTTTTSRYYMAIPVAILLLATPLIAVGIRKLYLKRKRIRRWCSCHPPSDSEGSNARWSTQETDRESDSETEF